jgi:hypothetical protein
MGLAHWKTHKKIENEVICLKGVVINKGENYYTDLKKLFLAIDNVQVKYNWLITKCECYPENKEYYELFNQEYCWLSGERLTEILNEENFQWIWAIFAGFKKDISLEQVLSYNLPTTDGYNGFLVNYITMQHPLADIEIVAWDGISTLFISKEQALVEKVLKLYPLSQELRI